VLLVTACVTPPQASKEQALEARVYCAEIGGRWVSSIQRCVKPQGGTEEEQQKMEEILRPAADQ
jgi:putative hemolysin